MASSAEDEFTSQLDKFKNDFSRMSEQEKTSALKLMSNIMELMNSDITGSKNNLSADGDSLPEMEEDLPNEPLVVYNNEMGCETNVNEPMGVVASDDPVYEHDIGMFFDFFDNDLFEEKTHTIDFLNEDYQPDTNGITPMWMQPPNADKFEKYL
uniref:Uncharacterized protein n=1 Tax=Oryza punctata TaxID=4537 RepID=A0A0E0LI81_ORYPU